MVMSPIGPESKFLEEMKGSEQYGGQWMAVLGVPQSPADGRLGRPAVASGKEIRGAYIQTRSAEGKTPLFVKIPDEYMDQPLIL